MTSVKSIYINLPVKDLTRTRAFWSKMGFTFNETFSDDKGLCLVLNEGNIYAMLVTYPFFQKFTDRPISEGITTQMLIAIEVESKEKVLEIMRIALESGGTRYRESNDHGWMYYDSFSDPDGHQWEVMFTDKTKMPG
jgi:uncharacterized protein